MMKTIFLLLSIFIIVDCNATKVKASIKASIVCNSCKNLIETELKNKKGIISVKVDVTSKKVKVVFEDTETSLSAIEDMIVNLGYDANTKKKSLIGFEKLPKCCQIDAGHHEQ